MNMLTTDIKMSERKRQNIPEDLLTKEEVASLLKVSIHTVTDFVKRGKLKGDFISGQGYTKFFDIKDVLKLKRERENNWLILILKKLNIKVVDINIKRVYNN